MGSYWNLMATVSLPIFMACVGGLTLSRFKRVDTRSLTDVSLFVLAPGMIIVALTGSTAEPQAFLLVGAFILIHTSLSAGTGWIVAQLLRCTPESRAGLILTSSFGNAVNYGLPVLMLAYGKAGVALGATYVIMQVVLVNTLGMYIASRSQVSPRRAAGNVARAPLIYACIVGLLLYATHASIPKGIQSGLTLVGDAYPAIVLMILGIQIGRLQSRGLKRKVVWAAVLIRMIAVPMFAKVTLIALGVHGLLASVLFVQSSMPAAINTSVLTEKYDGDKEQVALTVTFTTLLSFLYLPLLIGLH